MKTQKEIKQKIEQLEQEIDRIEYFISKRPNHSMVEYDLKRKDIITAKLEALYFVITEGYIL